MTTSYLAARGAVVAPEELRIAKAQELAQTLSSQRLAFATLVECRQEEEPTCREAVILNVEVELGQHTVYDIWRFERIAVLFSPGDEFMPEVLALRSDFPLVPHLNLRVEEFPRSLCVFDESYEELKLRWTAAAFVERIRTWLALTARGKLHADDQPLEPLLLGSTHQFVMPTKLVEDPEALRQLRLTIWAVQDSAGRYTFFADDAPPSRSQAQVGVRCVGIVLLGNAQQHGIIRKQPQNLRELHDFISLAGVDVLGALRHRLLECRSDADAAALLSYHLIVIAVLPKTRAAGNHIEATDIYAFWVPHPIKEVGEHIGLWAIHDGRIGAILTQDPLRQGQATKLVLLNPMPAFSRELAAQYSGPPEPNGGPLVAIGVGALGSQVSQNLLRMGYGRWTLIDKDVFMPHNLARHALLSWALGWAKADALAVVARHLFDDPTVAVSIVADILNPGEHREAIADALKNATTILDMSTSIAVARMLACDVQTSARRISLFLNPSGTDLVLLAEDVERTVPLDWLEMQYYRLVVQEEGLHQHLAQEGPRQRYGRSCRDLSATISQDQIGLHAAIGSGALREVLAQPVAQLVVWLMRRGEFSVTPVRVSPVPVIEERCGGWTVCTDQELLEQLQQQRRARVPNETGGVLMGTFDLLRKRIYIVLAVPSPPDSVEWPTLYIRECYGLTQRVEEIDAITTGQLVYVGEWHSHPPGYNCQPSIDDRQALRALAELRNIDNLPAVMAIVGEMQCQWYVENTMS